MTKRFWAGVMLFSLFVTMASGSFLYLNLQEKATVEVPLTKREPKPKAEPEKKVETVEVSTPTAAMKKEEIPDLPDIEDDQGNKKKAELVGSRNILFKLYSSRAKKVQIIGDFNKWYREPLKKKGKSEWSKAILLEPGTYKYMYVVDGKRIKDPNSKKVSKDGKSLITVKPLN